MRIDIMTLFPDMCLAYLGESIIGRARAAGKVQIECTDIRDYTLDKHRRVDDTPYGGGMGMIMQAQPIYDCYQDICRKTGTKPHLIYLTPQGKTLTQERVKELAQLDNIALLCGHYEGVDERVIEELQPEEISVGDYVLTGGELPALIVADAVSRMIPGVLSMMIALLKKAIILLFWSILSTHVRLSGAAEKFPKFLQQVITLMWINGAESSPLKERLSAGLICSKKHSLRRRISSFCPI